MAMKERARHFLRSSFMVLIAVGTIFGIFRLTTAGSLEPTVAPAGTFHDVSEVYDAIASSGFDSSSISADPNGSAFGIAKCIIARMTGSSCP